MAGCSNTISANSPFPVSFPLYIPLQIFIFSKREKKSSQKKKQNEKRGSDMLKI